MNNIDSFLKNNLDKRVVAVQGLGFVGAVMSLVVANSDEEEYAVIGVDLPQRKDVINKLNKGIFPISCTDPKVYKYFEEVKDKGNFIATDDTNAYSKADIIIVDINLDVEKNSDLQKNLKGYNVDLTGFKNAIRTLAQKCKEDVLILVETTVPPGTCQNIVKPIFEEEYDRRGLEHKFKIGHSYERVMPGPGYVDSIKNFYRVFSGVDKESEEAVRDFLKSIISTDEYPLTKLGSTNASEMSKVLENSFRAMNIAFIQEWTEFAESAEVDLFEVINAIRMRPTHQNIMRPGLGVGGYCLTKDPLLASWASQEFFHSIPLMQSEQAVKINDRMPLHTFKTFQKFFNGELKGLRVLILGISYLQNVGDTRYTPVDLLYDSLKSNEVDVILHDPFVEIWEEKGVDIQTESIDETGFDAIIIGTPHDKYIKEGLLENILRKEDSLSVVIDPHGAITESMMQKFSNHKFKVIGRGDV
ncbi:MAG: nucleotide sugar dehydrogenase [Gracilimonas sp.]|uniref:nucleotide sugar dehydrogenase n=1 Tax=Gracilimonas sp. TaxID=1974203 RepID=UPI001B0C47E0|nr:nucleotide sugar dehydrogenase [Gracilimonas sp.]MBO6587235.1 nucleotide sugar dehydrogenase [Gracilimonas sp.]MBO6614277.1 nucleotide sugar dehydrogenase [Gracilimonas sp.]